MVGKGSFPKNINGIALVIADSHEFLPKVHACLLYQNHPL